MRVSPCQNSWRLPLWLAMIVCLPGLANLAQALERESSGLVDVLYAQAWKAPESGQASAAGLRWHQQFEWYQGNHQAMWVFDLGHNRYAAGQPLYQTKELWWQYLADNFDIRLGRQLVIWGRADGLAVTDIVSPKDRAEFIAREYQDTRQAVDALRVRYLTDNSSWELYWLPVPSGDTLPDDKNNPLTGVFKPAIIEFNGQSLAAHYMQAKKRKFARHSELAARASFYFSALDFSLSFFHGDDREAQWQPQLVSVGGKSRLELTETHSRINMLGLDLAVPISEWVIRAEMAAIDGRAFLTGENQLTKARQIKLLLGLDWRSGDWMLTAQSLWDCLVKKHSQHQFQRRSTNRTLTFSLTRTLLRETLTLDFSALYQPQSRSSAASFKAEYQYTDNLKLAAGIQDYTSRSQQGLSALEPWSSVWSKISYSF
ncbi:MAG: hypothetical protein CSB48_09560 [Proteobacteria bacterium]|nr:MAG: hypothetical protein CSB48_09560 [Pseudomonadota bacterium]PIE40467.1 MAG: hypothetical protein CSA51_00520 [Gammaproteobacteria bacterium]